MASAYFEHAHPHVSVTAKKGLRGDLSFIFKKKKETDVSILTDPGKFGAVAEGVRASVSPLGGPFVPEFKND